MNTNKKIVFAIITIIILLVVTLAVGYFANLSFVDPLLSSKMQEDRKIERAMKYFPHTIGGYSLLSDPRKRIEITSLCNKAEDNSTLKAMGKTGDACMETITGFYEKLVASTTSTTTSSIIGVNLSKFTKSRESFMLLIEDTANADFIDGQKIFRTTPFRIGWSTSMDFDLVLIDESTLIASGRTETLESKGLSTGENEVLRYFFAKYPPEK